MRLRTLGGLDLLGADFRRPKPLLLLAFLALEGPQERRRLAELFWGRRDGRRNRLAKTVSRLRQARPELVRVDGSRLATPVACDVHELEAALDADRMDVAWSCYAGAFLAGVDPAGAGVELEEWVFATRERIAERLREGTLRRAEALAAEGRSADARRWAERSTSVAGAPDAEPEDLERMHRVLAAGGSPRAAEIRRLARSYGIPLDAPPARATAPPAPRRRVRLPQPARPLVGRETEIEALLRTLGSPDGRLVTLVGPGGVGKTRLAIAAARAHARRAGAAGDVAFVALDGVATSSGAPAAVAAALDVGLHGSDDPLDPLLRAVGERRLLLVLDNVEHLLPALAGELIHPLIEGCPNLAILATSRERVELAEGRVFPVEGLPVPAPGERSEGEPGASALDLLEACARRVDPEFALGAHELPHALELCRSVDGLPLALELAAAWTDTLPLAAIAAEVRRDLGFLAREAADLPARHRSVRAVLRGSWDRLAPAQRASLARLTVFRGGFDREAAAAVAGLDAAALAGLVGRSLVQFDRERGRYDLHALLRRYGDERLHASGEAEGARARHAAHVGTTVARRIEARLARDEPAGLRLVDAEHANLAHAWPTLLARGPAGRIERVAEILHRHAVRRARYGEGADALASAFEHLRRCTSLEDRRASVRVLALHADLLREWGRTDAARPLLRTCRRLVDDLRDRADARREGALLATTEAFLASDPGAAREHHERSLRLARASGDDVAAAETLVRLGMLWKGRGELERAEGLFEEARALGVRSGAPRVVAEACFRLGGLHTRQGRHRAGERLHREGLTLARETEDDVVLARGLRSLAVSRLQAGRFARASGCAREAAETWLRGGQHAAASTALAFQAFALLHLARAEDACRAADEAVALAPAASPGADALVVRGGALLLEGDAASAVRTLERAVGAYGRGWQDEPARGAVARALAAVALLRSGREDAARAHVRAALRAAVEVRSLLALMTALPAAALLSSAEGREAQAHETMARARSQPYVRRSRLFATLLAGRLDVAVPPARATERSGSPPATPAELWALAAELVAASAPPVGAGGEGTIGRRAGGASRTRPGGSGR